MDINIVMNAIMCLLAFVFIAAVLNLLGNVMQQLFDFDDDDLRSADKADNQEESPDD